MPEGYFPEIEAAHPGALASQWIPDDPDLWRVDRFRDFLEARKALPAAEVNKRLAELMHGDERWLGGAAPTTAEPPVVIGGITSEDEERQLERLNAWITARGLPAGVIGFDFADPDTGEQKAVFDLAWPGGIQEELSQPVAVLLDEESEVIAAASQAGYRCFISTAEFRRYIEIEILADAAA